VGLALDRTGFTVEDRDRNEGMYFVRYVEPELGQERARLLRQAVRRDLPRNRSTAEVPHCCAQPGRSDLGVRAEAPLAPEASANAKRILQRDRRRPEVSTPASMLRFRNLGSGSSGNATLVEASDAAAP
jgi:hypothetical protein